MNLKTINTILFDLDDTLINRDETMRRFLSSQYQKNGILHDILSENTFSDYIIQNQKHGYTDAFSVYKTFISHYDIKCLTAESLYEDLDNNYGNNVILFSDTIAVLKTLSERFNLAIITNGKISWQTRKISTSGLSIYFDNITISEEIGISKPNPEIFHVSLSVNSIISDQAVYVGDNPITDINGAVNSGIQAIWLDHNIYSAPKVAHEKISRLEDLLHIFPG